MVPSKTWLISPLRALRLQPWAAPSSFAPRIDLAQRVEEEKTPYYHPDRFYPAKLGDILHGRYQIVTKLGYGSGSTVWLARDLNCYRWMRERFVAIKIASNTRVRREGVVGEVATLRRISTANLRHEGWHFVRKLVDDFEIQGTGQSYACLVFEALREPLWLYCRRFADGIIPSSVFKVMLQMILHGLDYLHTQCQIVHTDLKPDNVMIKAEDPAIFERDAQDEYINPLPQKHTDGRIIYLSRNNYGQPAVPVGLVQIVDFDLSVLGNEPRSGCIQADLYRAPEVILDAGYTYSADIWNLGAMLWDVLEGRKLFQGALIEENEVYDEHLHLACISDLLGARPSDIASGRRESMFYDHTGSLHRPSPAPSQLNFEDTVRSMKGEEKKMFIQFVKRMLKWRPEERSTARELLDDPWLHVDFPQN